MAGGSNDNKPGREQEAHPQPHRPGTQTYAKFAWTSEGDMKSHNESASKMSVLANQHAERQRADRIKEASKTEFERPASKEHLHKSYEATGREANRYAALKQEYVKGHDPVTR